MGKKDTERISRTTLCLPIEQGGIQMISVRAQQQVMLLRWLHKACKHEALSHHIIVYNCFWEFINYVKITPFILPDSAVRPSDRGNNQDPAWRSPGRVRNHVSTLPPKELWHPVWWHVWWSPLRLQLCQLWSAWDNWRFVCVCVCLCDETSLPQTTLQW